MAGIAVEHLQKSFGEHHVLKDLSFTIESGCKVALLGASGCGKSLLLHTLAGLTAADAGNMYYAGQAVHRFPVSYMQQKDLLLPWYTLEQNASLPLTLAGVPAKEAYAQVAEHLPLFGLTGFAQHYPHQLSGGMRQRVALLRAIFHRQPIMLMDEPFSALDAITAQELRQFLAKLQQKENFTLLFVTHSVEESIDLADEIWIMHKDRAPQISKMEQLPSDYTARRQLLWQELGIIQK